MACSSRATGPTPRRALTAFVETLKLSLDLAERADRFETSIRELFDLRDALVHFRSAEEDALQPLSMQTREWESYRLDKAGWAVDLAYGVLSSRL